MWTSRAALVITPENRQELERLVRSGKREQRLALRARIVLGAADGASNSALAKALKTSRPTVLDWRQRFAEGGVDALYDDRPRGRSFKPLTRAKEAEIIATTQRAPTHATQWSCRSMAKICGVSKASVQRVWHANGLKPHLIKTFKLSHDPDFIEKLEDVVGLYLNPPDHALVFCIDEKSQIQALDRTQPGLPMKKGRAGTMTHDYKRHGTTCLFAALNVLDGTVIGTGYPRHRHEEFLKFLRTIDRDTSPEEALHLILDHYGTHTHPHVKTWLAKHPRCHLHGTPTSASWLNLVERWFGEITRQRIRRGVFKSVPEVVTASQEFIRLNNKNPKPFVWPQTVDDILKKIKHCKAVMETPH